MLARFNALITETAEFIKTKGRRLASLSTRKWLCDLTFVVNITKYLRI